MLIAFCPMSGDSLSTSIQNSLTVCDINLSLRVESEDMSISRSSSITQSLLGLLPGKYLLKNPFSNEMWCFRHGITVFTSQLLRSVNSRMLWNVEVFPRSSHLPHITSCWLKAVILSERFLSLSVYLAFHIYHWGTLVSAETDDHQTYVLFHMSVPAPKRSWFAL